MIEFFTTMNGWVGNGIVKSSTRIVDYPGGEIDIRSDNLLEEVAVVRGAEPRDLISLLMWADYRHRLGLSTKTVIPYLPGARQDRGEPLGAKVYADMINSADLDFVICFDPHSDVSTALIDRVIIVKPTHVPMPVANPANLSLYGFDVVLSPDSGGVRRAFDMAMKLHLPMTSAEKHRDPATGALSGFNFPDVLCKFKHPLIVDDICDGGGTFVGLAEAIREEHPLLDISLYVSHGIFSAGAERLSRNFARVFSTDTHPGSVTKPSPSKMEFVSREKVVPILINKALQTSRRRK